MIDGVIAGTGNSRYLKSNFSGDWSAFLAALNAGTFPIDLNGINEAGWTMLATALSKGNLLSDTTAAAWGGSSSSTLNNILQYAAARHGTCTTAAATTAKVVTLSNFALSTGAIIGVYFTYPNTATSITINVNSTGAKSAYFGASLAAGTQIPQMALFQYDGTYWQLLNGPAVQIATGSYTGSGLYGSSHPNSLTFPFAPKLVIVSKSTEGVFSNSNGWVNGFLWMYPLTKMYVNSASMICSLSGKTLSWYTSGSSEDWQMNASGVVYDYIAIG